MALSIISSNRVEALQHSLSSHISTQMLSSPFEAEVIVVPTFAMARWLNLKIAQQQGIAANIEYPLPASWIWQLATSILDGAPKIDPLSRDRMSWDIFQHLPELIDTAEFESINHYLRNDTTGIKRWQLSTRIADVFDRYQHYRPDMIKRWSSGTDNRGSDGLALDERWQAKLWRVLIEHQTQDYRGAVLDQLLTALKGSVNPHRLPERVSLFVLSSLPPMFIHLIHALAEHTTVTLYLHSPTDQYWADLKNQKSRLQLRLAKPQQEQYYDAGSELLTSWGRQGQTMQDLLLDNEGLITSEQDIYQPPSSTTLLQTIQQSIFELDDCATVMGIDDSLAVHICHSPMRECQVLHDQLLSMLQKNPGLNTEDILVMVPEISRYAPYIEAVFQSNDSKAQPTLAWNLSDITLADEHPLVLSFLQLLKLPQSRFSLSEILSLLDIEEVKQRFGLDEPALQDIRQLLDETQVRWAIDAKHKQQLGLPPTIENTWQQAKQRLFAGYAMAGDNYWNGIAALSQTQGDRAIHIGKFWHLFERLQHWRQRLTQSQTAQDWQHTLLTLLDDFFVTLHSSDNRLQSIRDVIAELDHTNQMPMSPELVSFWMEQQLAAQEKPGRLFSGGITFCGMRPMRCLPFEVICLLGMNDGDYPRRENRVDFDLMQYQWKPGDPLKGDEDRYLMLETLLCTRKILYVSYCGRSLKDNGECMPSVLVRELLDFVDARFEPDPFKKTSMSQQITTLHSMQAFSEFNFQPPMQSYNQYWCDIANLLVEPDAIKQASGWSQKPLEQLSDNFDRQQLDLIQLSRFLKHPVEYFFRQRLKVYLSQEESAIDEETFDLDGLEKWHLKQRVANDFLNQTVAETNQLSAEGLLPHGPAANSCMASIVESQENLIQQLKPYYNQPAETRDIQLTLDSGIELSGLVQQYYPGQGLMQFTSSKMQGRHFLVLWTNHLAVCASKQFPPGETSCLIANDQSLVFTQVEPKQAMSQLQAYANLYQQGMQYPLAIFPAASYAYAKSLSSKGDMDKAIGAAYKAWQSNGWGRFSSDDIDDAYVKLALRDNLQDPLTTHQFQDHAQTLYQLALDNGEFS